MKIKAPESLWWPYWALIKAGYATLQEMETHWSLTDVFTGLEAMKMFGAQEALASEEAKRKAERRR